MKGENPNMSIRTENSKTEKSEKTEKITSIESPKKEVIHTVSVVPPVMTQSIQTHPPSIPSQYVPINVPTRGPSEEYRQLGVLASADNSKILPLYGKRLWSGASKWQYYTQTDRFISVHLPVYKDGRDCSAEYGCDEIFDKDSVTVPQFDEKFIATLYHLDGPRYIPFV